MFVRGQPLHSTLTDVLVGNISGDCDQGTASSKPICIHFDIRFVFSLLHVYLGSSPYVSVCVLYVGDHPGPTPRDMAEVSEATPWRSCTGLCQTTLPSLRKKFACLL